MKSTITLVSRLFCLCLYTLVAPFIITADIHAAKHESMLIINSYSENEPWVNDLTQPILMQAATHPDIGCEMYNLNNAIIADSAEYASYVDNIIRQYEDDSPSYVVMIGNLAFDMRKRIKETWGDIPMLLITPNKEYFTLHDFFRSTPELFGDKPNQLLIDERDTYNFTAIIIPEFYRQTVDMMVGMIPEMNELIFMSDSITSNCYVAHGIKNYIQEQYPNIRFNWLKANQANSDTFQSYVVQRKEKTGLLLSTWLYEKQSATGIRIPNATELKMISASHSPIFSLRECYIPLGVIGGVYPSPQLTIQREKEVLDAMFAGKSMRDIPFFTVEDSYPRVNYRLMREYGLSESRCPEGTVFYSKPESFWVKYMWLMVILFIIALVIMGIMYKKNADQRKKIAALTRNNEFINSMPIPYSTATVHFGSDNAILSIDYAVKNEAFGRLLDENVVAGSPYKLFPVEFIAPKVNKLLNTGEIQTFSYHFDKSDSTYQFILCLVNTSLIKTEYVSKQIDVFAIDLTVRHKIEKQLARTKRKLDITLSVANLIPWQFIFADDEIVYDQYIRSQKFKRTMDIQNTETRSKFEEIIQQVYPEDRDKIYDLRRSMRNGETKEFKMRYRRYNDDGSGQLEWCEIMGAVTECDIYGKPLIATGSIEFITQQIEQQQKMADALERASESDRMKSAFLASMSHEIRTPLNAIVGFSNVIAYTQDENERHEFCDIINRNNEQLLTLINDVLDLAKIESNTININYNEVNVNQMLDHVYATMSIKIPHGVEFKVIKGEEECTAEFDQVRVVQILTNLISNACKFTTSGHITYGYELNQEDQIYFYVRDTGKGIDSADKGRIFDRFVKVDSFTPGTGLGLSICKNLVDKMGGVIGVESGGIGKGSLFWFTIPYIPSKASADDSQVMMFMKRSMPSQLLSGESRHIKVLIAEDNESNYRLLSHLLTHFEVEHATDGRKAVECFKVFKPDVVLMDITMPGMDGYDAFDRIRMISRDVPIIAVTANVYDSDRINILNHGFDGYVSKPITQKTILDAIGRVLTSDKRQSQE